MAPQVDGSCPHCKVRLDSHRGECSFSDYVHGSCGQVVSLDQDATRYIQDSHGYPVECRQCNVYLRSIESFFSHLRYLHDWDLHQSFYAASASSPSTANSDISNIGTLRASHESPALDTAIATHCVTGDSVRHASPCGVVRAASSDTSAGFPSSQGKSPSIPEPEETQHPNKRVKLVYKNKLVCKFLA